MDRSHILITPVTFSGEQRISALHNLMLFFRLLLIVCLAQSASGFGAMGGGGGGQCPDACVEAFEANGGCTLLLAVDPCPAGTLLRMSARMSAP